MPPLVYQQLSGSNTNAKKAPSLTLLVGVTLIGSSRSSLAFLFRSNFNGELEVLDCAVDVDVDVSDLGAVVKSPVFNIDRGVVGDGSPGVVGYVGGANPLGLGTSGLTGSSYMA